MREIKSAPTHGGHLLALPDEILLQILADVHRPKVLWSLMLSCRRLYRIVEPFAYSSVRLDTRARCISFVFSLRSYPERASYVKSLDLHSTCGESFAPPVVTSILNLLSNLQGLSIDLPFRGGEISDEVFESATRPSLESTPLQVLKNCTLRYSSHDIFWTLSRRGSAFQIPSIQCLTIINADVNTSIRRPTWNATSLEELHFIHCKMLTFCLAQMLKLSKALKRLTIIEPGLRALGPHDSNEYIYSTGLHYETLEDLILIRAERCEFRQISLRRLVKLSYLEIQPQVLFFSDISQILPPPLDSILPPNLERLVLVDINRASLQENGWLFNVLEKLFTRKRSEALLPLLKRVTLICSLLLEVPPLLYEIAQAATVELLAVGGDPRHNARSFDGETSESVKDFLYRYKN